MFSIAATLIGIIFGALLAALGLFCDQQAIEAGGVVEMIFKINALL